MSIGQSTDPTLPLIESKHFPNTLEQYHTLKGHIETFKITFNYSINMYLGPIHHPAIGIRIPEILLKGILSAFKKRNTVGTLMLSFVRETAPEYVINAPPGVYDITRGHTGTSIRKYMTLAHDVAEEMGVQVEIEADHITVTSPSKAVKRIVGVKVEYGLSDEELKESMDYIRTEIEEAVQTGYVDFFTIDTCEMVRLEVDSMDSRSVEERFKDTVPKEEAENLMKRYIGRNFVFIGSSGRPFHLNFSKIDVMRLALKYLDSLDLALKMYRMICEEMKKIRRPFGIEVAFDELPELTKEKDLYFYLRELWDRGLSIDFIAPNIGFKKRKDYEGDLVELRDRVERLSSIARSFGTLLSFHSGSGSGPFTGKGKGVYEALLEATGENLKYKVSGVYIELLFKIMESYPKGTRPRNLYERIFEDVYNYLKDCVEEERELSSPLLKRMIKEYEDRGKPTNSEEPIFKYFSFISLNLRDSSGRRYLREEIVNLYEEDENFREKFDKEVERLTLHMIEGLNFIDNVKRLSWWTK